jgi:hypothetical protein
MSVHFLELLQGWMDNRILALFPITNIFHLSVPGMFEQHNIARCIAFSEPERVVFMA